MSDAWRKVEGRLYKTPNGRKVAILRGTDDHGDEFWYMGRVTPKRDYDRLFKTRDEAFAAAERRYGKLS